MSKVLIPLPLIGFDPTEVAVPWKVLSSAGHEVVFATPDGSAAIADPIMVTGRGLGPLKFILRADANGRAAYQELLASNALNDTLTYDQAAAGDYDALMLPGGHDKSVKPYLESKMIQQIAARYVAAEKPVGAICHGVLVLARAKREDGSPVLHGRKVTSLVNRLENAGYQLTRFGTKRDSLNKLHIGFTVRDGNLLTARWPGDVHRWSVEMNELLKGRNTSHGTL